MIKNSLEDFNPNDGKLHGIFRGVVEDNNDPLKCGRCRVRIFGIHTENKEKKPTDGIPTDELPWAEPALSTIEGSISGFGLFAVPLQGSHVFLFFEDGNILNPIYFATAPGIRKSPTDSSKGFSDPDGKYPTIHRLGQSDFHSLARGETEQTVHNAVTNNKTTAGNLTEPDLQSNPEYPHNIVLATHGGIVIEIDSTPGQQRIMVFHPKGSYMGIDQDGKIVMNNEGTKSDVVKSDRDKIVGRNENSEIGGNVSRNLTGNEENSIGGNETKSITGNVEKTIGGNNSNSITGDRTNSIGGSETKTITGDQEKTISGNKVNNISGTDTETVSTSKTLTTPTYTVNGTLIVNGAVTMAGGSNANITCGNATIDASGNVEIDADGDITIKGDNVKLNPIT